MYDIFMTFVREGDTYLFLLPIYGILLFGERLGHALTGRAWDDLDAAANVALTVLLLGLNVVLGHLLPLAVMVFVFKYANLFVLGEGLLGWILAALLYDFFWYVDHRIGHRVGLFWAMHQVHHSSTAYNTTVASRGFILDITLLSRPLFYLLPVLGVSPLQFITIVMFSNIWGIAQHTGLVGKLGWLDWVLATPSNHKVHHGSDATYIDRNFGEVLMIWDHLFGTYQKEDAPPTFGLTEPLDSYNLFWIQAGGLRWLAKKIGKCTSWQDKLGCLYRPPEWYPGERRGDH